MDGLDYMQSQRVNGYHKPYTGRREPLSTEQLDSLIADARIDHNKEYQKPPALLMIDGVPVLTKGSMSTIQGSPKSRKSFLATYIAAKYLNPAAPLLAGDHITVPMDVRDRRVLWFDTEMGQYYASQVGKRIFGLAGDAVKNRLDLYDLRGYGHTVRREAIDHVVSMDGDDAAIIVIDGVRDLLLDVNKPDESTEVTEFLLSITARFPDTHLITVVHTTKMPGSEMARGHQGSDLAAKSESVIQVVKDTHTKDLSTVKGVHTRGEGFDEFALRIVDGLPVVDTSVRISQATGRPRGVQFSDFAFDKHADIITRTFQPDDTQAMGTTDLRNALKGVMEAHYLDEGKEFGMERAGVFINEYKRHGYIVDVSESTRARYQLDHDRIVRIKRKEVLALPPK